jgi:hypothetical protein
MRILVNDFLVLDHLLPGGFEVPEQQLLGDGSGKMIPGWPQPSFDLMFDASLLSSIR